jgi:hypothetical protein
MPSLSKARLGQHALQHQRGHVDQAGRQRMNRQFLVVEPVTGNLAALAEDRQQTTIASIVTFTGMRCTILAKLPVGIARRLVRPCAARNRRRQPFRRAGPGRNRGSRSALGGVWS